MNLGLDLSRFNNTKLKKIVNVYQVDYINGKSSGLGDFIRGSFCFMQLAKLLNLEFDIDFLWIGRFIVKTLVLEPNAPSIDIVSHDGWQTTELDEAATACEPVALFEDTPGDLLVDEPVACLDELFK